MSTYSKTIKVTCSCGGSMEVTDQEGHKTWSAEQVKAWQEIHKKCLELVNVPAALAPLVRDAVERIPTIPKNPDGAPYEITCAKPTATIDEAP